MTRLAPIFSAPIFSAPTLSGPLLSTALLIAVAGCTTNGDKPATAGETAAPGKEAGLCQSDKTAALAGTRAMPDEVERIKAAVGAKRMRWVGPGRSMTMEYDPYRVNVWFDPEKLVVIKAQCG